MFFNAQGKFKLFCFILQKSTNAFHIDIAASETVSDLKDAILAKNPNSLRNVESQQLTLFKVVTELSFYITSTTLQPPISITYCHHSIRQCSAI